MDFDSLYLCVKDILRYSYICESVLNLKVKKMDRAYLLEKIRNCNPDEIITSFQIDTGAKYYGCTVLVKLPGVQKPIMVIADVLTAIPKIEDIVAARSLNRGTRRTNKSKKRRNRKLRAAIGHIDGADKVLAYCKRRGVSYAFDQDEEETSAEDKRTRKSREEVLDKLKVVVRNEIPDEQQDFVYKTCEKLLNAEERKCRIKNRNPSKCDWEGCNQNVPASRNAIFETLEQTLYPWLTQIFRSSKSYVRLENELNECVKYLNSLDYRNKYSIEQTDDEEKQLDKQLNNELNKIRDIVKSHASKEHYREFSHYWTKCYRKQLANILKSSGTGRTTFCRQHSSMYVAKLIAGEVIPVKPEIYLKDIECAAQKLTYAKLESYLLHSVLPTLKTIGITKIDSVCVESASGSSPSKAKKQKVSNKTKKQKCSDEEFQQGPMFKFDSRKDMLLAEFDKLCAYCGEPLTGSYIENEHILPRSRFPYDSYFNILPACEKCNRRKGARTPYEAGMTISTKALDAFDRYIKKKKFVHPSIWVKRNLLSGMTHQTNGDAERELRFLCRKLFISGKHTQTPKRLARLIATSLSNATGIRPQIKSIPPKFVYFYRNAVLPDFNKYEDKKNGGVVNHIIDSALLGCDFPSPHYLLSGRYSGCEKYREFVDRLKDSFVAVDDSGMPICIPIRSETQFFQEQIDKRLPGYSKIDMSKMNWNSKRKIVSHYQPQRKVGYKLVAARDSIESIKDRLLDLNKKQGTDTVIRDATIESIRDEKLKSRMLNNPDRAAYYLIEYVQQSIKYGSNEEVYHPTAIEMKQMRDEFVNDDPELYVTEDKELRKQVPNIFGMRIQTGQSESQISFHRVCTQGDTVHHHHYMQDIGIRHIAIVVHIDKKGKKQNQAITVTRQGKVYIGLGTARKSVDRSFGMTLQGRAFGEKGSRKKWDRQWHREFRAFCKATWNVERIHILTTGCVFTDKDGISYWVRNMDPQDKGIRIATAKRKFVEIERVFKSPHAYQKYLSKMNAITK
jgi:5-methylcytosine-specific restriction endonuclease McrA